MSITRNELKAYPKPVVDALLAGLKENPNLRVKPIDSTHLRIMTGDRSEVPFKISASRPAEPTLGYLLPWLEARRPKSDPPVEVQVEVSTKKEPTMSVVPIRPEPEPDEGPGHGFVETPEGLQCTVEGCDYFKAGHDRRGLHLHAMVHGEEGQRTRAENAKRSGATRSANHAERKRITVEAISTLIDVWALEDLKPNTAEVERLRAENEALKTEVGDLKARLDLLREALKA